MLILLCSISSARRRSSSGSLQCDVERTLVQTYDISLKQRIKVLSSITPLKSAFPPCPVFSARSANDGLGMWVIRHGTMRCKMSNFLTDQFLALDLFPSMCPLMRLYRFRGIVSFTNFCSDASLGALMRQHADVNIHYLFF